MMMVGHSNNNNNNDDDVDVDTSHDLVEVDLQDELQQQQQEEGDDHHNDSPATTTTSNGSIISRSTTTNGGGGDGANTTGTTAAAAAAKGNKKKNSTSSSSSSSMQQNIVSNNKNSSRGSSILIGILYGLSLLLNVGLMIYAHLGLSAVIYSSIPPLPSSSSTTSPSTGGGGSEEEEIVNGNNNNNNNDDNNNTSINDEEDSTISNNNLTSPSSSTTIYPSSICTADDYDIWINGNGQEERAAHTDYCSRTYGGTNGDNGNGGCLVDSDCVEECFQTMYGYSAQCSTCFGTIPKCSVDLGCTFACIADGVGNECLTCSEPCIIDMNICLGFQYYENQNQLSNELDNDNDNNNNDQQQPQQEEGGGGGMNNPLQAPSPSPPESICTMDDYDIWMNDNGQDDRPVHSNYCSREYNDNGCLLDTNCIEECFQTVYGYTKNCTTCFSAIPQCSVDTGCSLSCAADGFSDECQTCNIPCINDMNDCLGFEYYEYVMMMNNSNTITTTTTDYNSTLNDDGTGGGTNTMNVTNTTTKNDSETETGATPPTGSNSATSPADNTCDNNDNKELLVDDIDNWYIVYNLTFPDSIRRAWDGDARLLSFLIVIFSGIWPYLKNVILVYVWYIPMKNVIVRNKVIRYLHMLSKYTLVDVFAVIAILIGTQLQLNVGGGIDAMTRGEPRFAIIAFFIATLWEFIQIEYTIHIQHQQQEQKQQEQQNATTTNSGGNSNINDIEKEMIVDSNNENDDDNNHKSNKKSMLSFVLRLHFLNWFGRMYSNWRRILLCDFERRRGGRLCLSTFYGKIPGDRPFCLQRRDFLQCWASDLAHTFGYGSIPPGPEGPRG